MIIQKGFKMSVSFLERGLNTFVFGFILLVVFLIILSPILNLSGFNHEQATKHAQDYANQIGNHTSVSCNKYDSDANGYVSCTIFMHHSEPLEIECGVNGCRKRMLVHNGRR